MMTALLLILSACGQHSPKSTAPGPAETRLPTLAAPGPACQYVDWGPFHNIKITCVEIVYNHVTPPEAAPELGGLAFGPDGTLYVARTALGEIWAMRDDNNDGFMDDPFPVADGLRLPIALTVYDGALVVLTADAVLRLDRSANGRFDDQTVLISDLTPETGLWPGSVGIGPDERLYVSLGASCDLCEGVANIQPGQIVSYALDGTDPRIVATGLRQPADFAWHPDSGVLWVVDSGRILPAVTTVGPPDELNRVTPGADFGFPNCYGNREPVLPSGPSCADTEPPQVTFPHQSAPGGIAFYMADGFTFWQGDLIVALQGSRTRPEPEGYALIVVGFEGADPDGAISQIAPDSHRPSAYADYSLGQYALSGFSFYPYHPADVVIDKQGWIYLSVQEGRIFRFRPRPAHTDRSIQPS